MDKKTIILLALGLIAGAAVGYYFGYDHGFEKSVMKIDSFEECAQAGYPIMESFPEQCRTPDGRSFTRQVSSNPDEGVACTMEAMMCPDGSYVGRQPPNCEFAKCLAR